MHQLFVMTLVTLSLAAPVSAFAQGGDFTIFLGGAYPVYDERLTLRPSVPSLGSSEFDDLLESLALIRFDPVIVNAQAGLVFRF